ncbi:MAG: hypothetical protein JWN86_4759 [Planctomycetota bacterium]|nr:hypothetical protein [Planctomycetota bacterium]
MWTCPNCQEKSDQDFDICWNCGTSREGDEDPNFLTADECGPIDDPAEDGGLEAKEELDDEFGVPYPDIVECYSSQDIIEARFIAEQLRAIGIPAVSDKISLTRGALGGMIPSASPHVRVRPQDLTRARTWIAGYEQRLRDRNEAHS